MTTEKLRSRNITGPRAGDSSTPLRCARNDNGEATLSERHWFKGARFLRSTPLGMTTEKLCCRNVIGPRAGDSSTPLHFARNDNGEATLSERHWSKGARFLDSAALGMTTEKLCCRNVIGPRAGDSSTPLHSARNDNGCLSSRAQRCPSHHERNAAPVITSATLPQSSRGQRCPSHHERSCPRVTPSAAVPESFRAPLPPGHSKRSTSSLSFRVERS